MNQEYVIKQGSILQEMQIREVVLPKFYVDISPLLAR